MNKRLKYILYFSFLFCFCFLCLEILAQQLWKTKYIEWLKSGVNAFGFIDKSLLLERYKPGYKIEVKQLLSELKHSNKTIGYLNTSKEVEEYNINQDSTAFKINKYGFKGPEIALEPHKDKVRILCIGDSCTFGPYIDKLSYPRQLELLLNLREANKFEVINAGHLGYNLEQVNNIVNEWLRVEPDIVITYLGWNRTILRGDPKKNDWFYDKCAIYRIFYHLVINRADLNQVENLFTREYDTKDHLIAKLKRKTFGIDLMYLDNIITKVRKRNKNTKVVLVTLAGLFTTTHQPTEKEINKGYSTAFSSNLAVWAVLSRSFNVELRKYAVEKNICLFDLEKLADEYFYPRNNYFSDTVHPSPLGNKKIAELMAQFLEE